MKKGARASRSCEEEILEKEEMDKEDNANVNEDEDDEEDDGE
jgi:hypothetical protein